MEPSPLDSLITFFTDNPINRFGFLLVFVIVLWLLFRSNPAGLAERRKKAKLNTDKWLKRSFEDGIRFGLSKDEPFWIRAKYWIKKNLALWRLSVNGKQLERAINKKKIPYVRIGLFAVLCAMVACGKSW